MEPHQQRVIDERNELDDKIDKLARFMKSEMLVSLPVDEQDRLDKQLKIMWEYSSILQERMAAF